nr:DUF1653 domain-containing protein [Amphritea atlantica]
MINSFSRTFLGVIVALSAGIYRHYKGANYEVLHLARHSETEEWLVVYKPCYGDHGVWVRPLTMFIEEVVGPDGDLVPRFQLLSTE